MMRTAILTALVMTCSASLARPLDQGAGAGWCVASSRLAAAAPSDTNAHRSATVTHRGVRLHYLDWGGSGPTVVLLPGYGLTAHAFDDIAPVLAHEFQVLALTPRGFGESDAPADTAGYTIAVMADDLHAVLDSLGIAQAALVGHSMSGSTIGAFARAYPERVTKLGFLDAFPYFAAAGGDSVTASNPVPGPGFSGPMTYPRVRAFLRRYRFSGWSAALEHDLRANVLGDELRRRQALTVGYIRDQRSHPVDLGGVAAPALQLCAVPTVASEYPWLRTGTRDHARAAAYVARRLRPFSRALCAEFPRALPGGRTLEVTGSHYVFFTQPAWAARTRSVASSSSRRSVPRRAYTLVQPGLAGAEPRRSRSFLGAGGRWFRNASQNVWRAAMSHRARTPYVSAARAGDVAETHGFSFVSDQRYLDDPSDAQRR
jgi:pimeloyl-ACP methyl ester carboxylesterase